MNYRDFSRLFSLSKTLRFELRPLGRTQEHIEQKGFLQQDKLRAQKYILVKRIIDEYHKDYINRRLSSAVLQCESIGKNNSLSEYYQFRKNKNRIDDRKILDNIQAELRKQIVRFLTSSDEFGNLFKEKLIKEVLPKYVQSEDERSLISEFYGFTTYFVGFNENRKNMYSDEAKSTSIAYRIINENLPKFVDNMEVFEKIMQVSEISENVALLFNDFKSLLKVNDISEIFELSYYNSVLTQNQIEIYNALIGGRTKCSEKIKGLNEYINLYNQKHKEVKLPKFKLLYKQILSDREQISLLPDKFETSVEVLEAIGNNYSELKEYIANLKILLENISLYSLNGIFLRNDQQLSHISKRVTGDWQCFKNAIMADFKENVRKQKRRESLEKYEEELNKLYSRQASFDVAYINKVSEVQVETYFAMLGAIDSGDIQCENLFAKIENAYTGVSVLLQNPYPKDKHLNQDKQNCALIKEFLDSIIELLHFVKPLCGAEDEADKDARFYGEFTPIFEQLNDFTKLYDKVRNFVTRKPYSIEKVKLNFNNSQLLGGWDKNKEREYLTVILRKNNNYYLAIMDKSNNKIFTKFPCDGECYEKMVYKLISAPTGIGGFIRKCFGTAQQLGWVCPQNCINSDGKIIIKDEEAENNLKAIIDCQKNFFEVYEKDGFKYRDYDFNFLPSDEYKKLSDFYSDVEAQGYKLWFEPISASYIDTMVDEGKLYLFQIYSKDFSEHSKGTPNMHTLYWKMLFDERNLTDVVYKLNGKAELFYREKSIEYNNPTHKANIPIRNKNTSNPKKDRVLSYDLIKDKRYTMDKYLFHVSLTLNFKNKGIDEINTQVREYLRTAENTHIIGIDRGERNLLYLVVIDSKGKICEQISLNEICTEHNGSIYKTDYHSLLDEREKKRMQERQNWQVIEGIKELKGGYLSQVVHKIAQLIVKYHAIVVLEDLNLPFMRGRQKVEKSVYQQFEKMLINKLNYLVDKKIAPDEPGGLLRAYQLTNRFDSFEKLGKQSGFLFYVPAWNTSKIDPVTGFVNMLDLRYESVETAKAALCKFDRIQYNEQRDYFEFYLDYDKFTSKASGTRTKWVVCTLGTRIETFRNTERNSQWDNRVVDITAELKRLFEQCGIDISNNLKNQIAYQHSKAFFCELLRLLRLTMQMRNSITGTDVDCIVSPVADENGKFFDSREVNELLPKDADANGAYNIARKGLMIIEQIKQCEDFKSIKFDISNKRWLQFAQKCNE